MIEKGVRQILMRDDLRDPAEVAVVIPACNCARYLPRAIDSVLAQTYRDYQIFVIDDGSTDGTDVIVQRYGDRVTYVQQPHAGVATARNRGISLSASPYVAFLDADDAWLPAKLERQLEFLKSQPDVGLVCSDFLMEGVVYTSQIDHPSLTLSGRYFEYLLYHCFILTSAVVVRRQCLNEVGGFHEPLKVSEDCNLWLRIASRWPVAAIAEIFVLKHNSSGSLSASTSIEDRFHHAIAAFEHVLLVSTGLTKHERRVPQRVIADRYYNFGSYLLLQKDPRAARPILAKAWRNRIFSWKAATKFLASMLPPKGLRFLIRLWRNSVGGLRA
jgi:glycosyltransferase involved in cell wall biosynthesis